ncbi:hypothetical protein [uncultured Pseudomonas sp.]|uniref:hypothetical protein n=1 Tax=uncultured Pseudomonas sp. TaxID=114707 RepID=UPI00262FD298|nr:hypothetical protein [uncultured Pseudomonas sp.]
MNVTIQVMGLKQVQRQLEGLGKKVDPVLRGALNTTATKTRSERFVKPLTQTIRPQRVRAALKVKRARRGRMDARIIPSSSGVLVANYRTWGFDVIDATRARIWVRGPRGRKIAAGFVNPSSSQKLPLSTRSSKTAARGKTYAYKRALQLARGPSTAYWFKQLATTQTIKWTSDYLQAEFAKRLQKEIDKGPR